MTSRTTPPGARPTGATPAPGPDPTPDAERFRLRSVTLLRLLRTVAVLACLVAGAVGAFVLSTTSTSLGEISAGTQQILRLQQIKGDILRADGLATHGLAQGTPAAALTEYNEALLEASQLIVEASRAQAYDQAQLTAVNGGLVTYVLTMERARTAYPADNATGLRHVADASATLTAGTVPALDTLIAANTARVDAARAGDRLWAVGLALIPVLLLIGISVWLARRTKRILNIGLLLALASSVVLWQLVDTNLAQSAAAVDGARQGSLRTATAAGTAYSKLAEAKAVGGRQLLQPAQTGTLEAAWSAAMTEVDSAVGKLDNRSTTDVAAYRAAHTALVDLLKANKVTEARAAAANTTTGVNPTYQTASDGLLAEFSLAKVATANDMSGHQQNLQLAWILALLLGLFGAGAAWFGIAQRLREYR
jgi:hypothetical protein